MLKYIWSLINNERGNLTLGGGAKTTKKNTGPSAFEAAQQLNAGNFANAQTQALQKLQNEQNLYYQTPQGQQELALLAQANQNLMGGLQGQMLNPQQQQMIEQYYGAQQTAAEQALKRRADEIAGMRGTPVSDNSALAGEMMRAQNDIGTSFGGQRAGAMLNQGNIAQQQALALAQFQQQLRQANAQNRLQLGQAQAPGLPLANMLGNQRIAMAPTNVQAKPQFRIGAQDIGRLGMAGFQLGGGNMGGSTGQGMATLAGLRPQGYSPVGGP